MFGSARTSKKDAQDASPKIAQMTILATSKLELACRVNEKSRHAGLFAGRYWA